MENKRSFPLFISGFWLKVLAILTMTIDHVGLLMQTYGYATKLASIFRFVGRFALPLFCFMVFEGVIHTKSFKKYALRLGIMASVISLSMLLLEVIPPLKSIGDLIRDYGIIFLDLLLGALAVYLLMQKKWYIKLLALLPLAYGVLSYIANSIEACNCYQVLWLPFFLRAQYGWYGIALIMGFYLAFILTKLFISITSQKMMVPVESYDGSDLERNALNIISALMLVIITILFFYINEFTPPNYVFVDYHLQLYAMIAGAFILLYNGARGYNKKWFQYGCYLYYVIHIPLLAAIFFLINYLMNL